jgi:hypothetical protein
VTMLGKTFDWMQRENYSTNESTGLHVSFSLDGKTNSDDYDFLKMMVLFDENYTANLFDRLGQSYCQQMREVLFRDFQRHSVKTNDRMQTAIMSSRQIETIAALLKQISRSLESKLGTEKYYTFRHRADGVVEFRSMGGEDYETKFDTIRKQIITMAYLMKVGADPTMMVREYVERVYKMLTGTKYQNPKLGSGVGRIDAPSSLSTFRMLLDRDPALNKMAMANPMGFLKIVAMRLKDDKIRLEPAQLRQLRFYIKRSRITAEAFRTFLRNDALYNAIGGLIGWPVIVPGTHDERQQTLPFTRAGQDLSGQVPVERETNRNEWRQSNLGLSHPIVPHGRRVG